MKKTAIFVAVGLSLVWSYPSYADELVVSGNGEGSSNQVSISSSNTSTTQQTNTADVQNNSTIDANTGNNTASDNSGDTTVQTGSVAIGSTIENSLNASGIDTPCCPSDVNANIANNGSDSTNLIDFSYTTETSTSVYQNTTIANTIYGSANTGGNSANDNGGNTSIHTGSIYVSENIKNGPINASHISAPTGSGGDVFLSIFGNGDSSTNTIASDFNSSSTVYNIFTANIFNSSVWDLNTGRNVANGNIGGVDLQTGDIFFASSIINGPINVSRVDINCCDEENPEDPPVGGDNPAENQKDNPSSPTSSANTSSSSSSGSSSENGGGIGSLLPTTGNLWTLIMTLASIVLFFFGWYLRLRSGNAPPRLAYATA